MHKILVRKPEGRGSLGILRHIQEDNNKINLRDIGWLVTNMSG
jgi:hypothetical protein